MAILWSSARGEEELRLEGARIYLRAPELEDFSQWAELRALSRNFLTRWEPIWPSDDLTKPAFRRRLRRYAKDRESATAYPFFLFRRDDNALLGGVTLSDVRYGVVQSGVVGYWMGAPYAGRGHMTEALRMLLPFAFDTLSLHRIEAACLPENKSSQALLRRVGFEQEGYVRQYLKINGAWHDHLLFSMLASDPRL